MTPDQIDDRLRALGIPDEMTARDGTEPPYVHIRVDGRVANWYSTAPIGMLMLKSDVAVISDDRRAQRITIEVGR